MNTDKEPQYYDDVIFETLPYDETVSTQTDVNTYSSSPNIQLSVRHWLYWILWDTEITLTFSNDISKKQAEHALLGFWNRVDRKLYGNAVERFDKRCERAVILEGDGLARRYHFHCLAVRPKDRFTSTPEFCKFLREQWLIDNPNNFAVSFTPIRNRNRYLNYVLKNVPRDNCDALNLYSSHISAANRL